MNFSTKLDFNCRTKRRKLVKEIEQNEVIINEFMDLISGYFTAGKTEQETVELLTPVFQKTKKLPLKTISTCIREAHKRLTKQKST